MLLKFVSEITYTNPRKNIWKSSMRLLQKRALEDMQLQLAVESKKCKKSMQANQAMKIALVNWFAQFKTLNPTIALPNNLVLDSISEGEDDGEDDVGSHK